MCTARPGWQTMSFRWPAYKKTLYNVEVNMVDILEVDTKRQVITYTFYSYVHGYFLLFFWNRPGVYSKYFYSKYLFKIYLFSFQGL